MEDRVRAFRGVVYDGSLVCLARGIGCDECHAAMLATNNATYLSGVVTCVLCCHLATTTPVPGVAIPAAMLCRMCNRIVCARPSCWDHTAVIRGCVACGFGVPRVHESLNVVFAGEGTLMSQLNAYARYAQTPESAAAGVVLGRAHTLTVAGVRIAFEVDLMFSNFFQEDTADDDDGRRRRRAVDTFIYRPAGAFGMVLFGRLVGDDGNGERVAIKVPFDTRIGHESTVQLPQTQYAKLAWWEAQVACAVGLHNDGRFNLNGRHAHMPPTSTMVAVGAAESSCPWLHQRFVVVTRPVFAETTATTIAERDVQTNARCLGIALEYERLFFESTGLTHGDIHSDNFGVMDDEDGTVVLIDFGLVHPLYTKPSIRVLTRHAEAYTYNWTQLSRYWRGKLAVVAAALWPDVSLDTRTSRIYIAPLMVHTVYTMMASFVTTDLIAAYPEMIRDVGTALRPLIDTVLDVANQRGAHNHRVKMYAGCLDAAAKLVKWHTDNTAPVTSAPSHSSISIGAVLIDAAMAAFDAEAGNEEIELSDGTRVVLQPSPPPANVVPAAATRPPSPKRTRVSSRVEYTVHRNGRATHPTKDLVQWRVLRDPTPPTSWHAIVHGTDR